MSLQYLLCTKERFSLEERSDLDAGSPHLILRAAGKLLDFWMGPALSLSQTTGMCSGKGRDMTVAGCDR